MADNPLLTQATITFMTSEDGEITIENTQIRITIFTSTELQAVQEIASYHFQSSQGFPDGTGRDLDETVHKVVDLPLTGALTLNNLGDVKIGIGFRAQGCNPWEFKYQLDLKFADGSIRSHSPDDIKILGADFDCLEEYFVSR